MKTMKDLNKSAGAYMRQLFRQHRLDDASLRKGGKSPEDGKIARLEILQSRSCSDLDIALQEAEEKIWGDVRQ